VSTLVTSHSAHRRQRLRQLPPIPRAGSWTATMPSEYWSSPPTGAGHTDSLPTREVSGLTEPALDAVAAFSAQLPVEQQIVATVREPVQLWDQVGNGAPTPCADAQLVTVHGCPASEAVKLGLACPFVELDVGRPVAASMGATSGTTTSGWRPTPRFRTRVELFRAGAARPGRPRLMGPPQEAGMPPVSLGSVRSVGWTSAATLGAMKGPALTSGLQAAEPRVSR
jgi:hypothetical protein